MFDIFSTKPDVINEKGTKFWLDKDLTNYAREKGLKNIQVLYAQTIKGYKSRIITENKIPIYDSQLYENIAVKIDILAMIQKR